MSFQRNVEVFCGAILLTLFAGSSPADHSAPTPPSVVMVCEHGAVKSLIASLLFDREAVARDLPFRAISRGVDPYETVPAKIATALEEDGFDIAGFDPQKLSMQEVAMSARVVTIGADLSEFQSETASTILEWDDVPPASVDYEASKAVLLHHVEALLDDLAAQAQ